ncbi:Uncharacterised protein [Candidatus Ornithobacterium hominis]|uniref:hypothetical protein n=1 Tax=Candidatus Ornithobacterium hominis TaxID=2497989 RepID=UPI000E5C56C6|nr:hypothetical protein [Candidatus Ornithobacterium hominis]SZD72745.1 Uncharacterised protein [Candidatus Ornithobacterium hominis]
MSKWAEIDFNKLSVLLTPTFLRKKSMLAWLRVLISPIGQLYAEWHNNRQQNLYKLRHNGQICYLRAVLNDEFDPQLRRIRIDDGAEARPFYIYTEGENKPKWLTAEAVNNPTYLHRQSAYAKTGVDFYVHVPSDLNFDKNKMQALIDFYRLASKRYEII